MLRRKTTPSRVLGGEKASNQVLIQILISGLIALFDRRRGASRLVDVGGRTTPHVGGVVTTDDLLDAAALNRRHRRDTKLSAGDDGPERRRTARWTVENRQRSRQPDRREIGLGGKVLQAAANVVNLLLFHKRQQIESPAARLPLVEAAIGIADPPPAPASRGQKPVCLSCTSLPSPICLKFD